MRSSVATFIIVLALGLAISAASRCSAQFFIPEYNPVTYTSPSGEYTLTIDPNDRYADNGATAYVRRNGATVWKGQMAVALIRAAISDSGTWGGYGFSEGKRPNPPALGQFHVMILDRRGVVHLDHKTNRTASYFLDTASNPNPAGLIFDPANDRMVVRVEDPDVNRGLESWWTYRLSTAQFLTKIEPKALMANSEPARFVIDARAVAGTNLILAHWWRFARGVGGRPSLGAWFTLVDPACKPVWSMELPQDYSLPNEDAQDRLMNEIRGTGAILRSNQSGRFDLRYVAAGQRVSFAVTNTDAGTWNVTEIGRTPYPPLKAAPRIEAIVPARQMRYLGSTVLPPEYTPAASAVRDLDGFVLAAPGQFGFLRHEAVGPDTLVMVDDVGNVIHQVRLGEIPIEKDSGWSGYVWTGGSQFVLTRSTSGITGKASAWNVDASTGAVVKLNNFDSPFIRKLAVLPGGGFVALTEVFAKYTMWDELHAFTPTGKRIWSMSDGGGYSDNDPPGKLFSPEDVAVMPGGNIAVLDVIKHSVQFYNSSGQYLNRLDLDKLWKRKLEYPSHIVPDTKGGFLVFDFGGDPPLIRANADGTVRETLKLPLNASAAYGTLSGLAVDTQGSIWTSDGHSLKRLDAAGRVDRVLGDTPTATHLGHIDDLQMTNNGRIYAFDARAGTAHIFDSNCKSLGICSTGSGFDDGPMVSSFVHPVESGSVYITNVETCYRFNGEGKLLARFKTDGNSNAVHLATYGAGDGFWSYRFQDAHRINCKGRVIADVDRLPDRSWIPSIVQMAPGPNGSVAILTFDAVDSAGSSRVSLYSASGAPIAGFAIPAFVKTPSGIAYDGNKIVVGGQGVVAAFDKTGKPLWQFKPLPRLDNDASWLVYLVGYGKELRLYDGNRTVYRYLIR